MHSCFVSIVRSVHVIYTDTHTHTMFSNSEEIVFLWHYQIKMQTCLQKSNQILLDVLSFHFSSQSQDTRIMQAHFYLFYLNWATDRSYSTVLFRVRHFNKLHKIFICACAVSRICCCCCWFYMSCVYIRWFWLTFDELSFIRVL